MFKSRRGITLIALVVTIIVLLILAGIAITMLTGNNSVLNKSTQAREKNLEGQIRDEIALAWNAVQTKGIPKKWKLREKRNELLDLLNDEDSNTTIDDVENGDKKIKITYYKGYESEINTEDGIIVYLRKIGEYNGGGNSGGDSGITTPTSAEDVLKVGVYVTYNGQPYRVLYDTDSTYGRIEIVSVNSLTNVTLGKNDPAELASAGQSYVNSNGITLIGTPGSSGTFDRAKWSYNNAIATLNYKAQAYLTNLADRARCIGSDPADPNKSDNESNPSMYSPSEYTWMADYGWNGIFKEGDNNWLTDDSALGDMDAHGDTLKWDTDFWVASRNLPRFGIQGGGECICPCVSSSYEGINGTIGINGLASYFLTLNSNGTTTTESFTRGFRPVIRLKSGLKVTGGQGTSGSPYTLALGTN